MFKKILYAVIAMITLAPLRAYAFCPVCTVAVGGALVLLERWGVDNTISGIWIGGLLVSVSLWTINYFRSRKWTFRGLGISSFLFYYITTLVPLYFTKAIGLPNKMLWGLDKTLIGVIIGSLAFFLSQYLYDLIKRGNNERPLFPFQKVAMPILILAILSMVFYFVTR